MGRQRRRRHGNRGCDVLRSSRLLHASHSAPALRPVIAAPGAPLPKSQALLQKHLTAALRIVQPLAISVQVDVVCAMEEIELSPFAMRAPGHHAQHARPILAIGRNALPVSDQRPSKPAFARLLAPSSLRSLAHRRRQPCCLKDVRAQRDCLPERQAR